MKSFYNNKVVLITGGTGSFGKVCVKHLIKNFTLKKIIVLSRDELKQFEMQQQIKDKRVRYFIGDIRDYSRLRFALKDVDYVFHAAALKQVPAAEYNPIECINTNVYGTENLIKAAIECKVKKVLMLSTDKAVNPINLYGATKLCAEKLFINANYLAGSQNTSFSIARYGNVINSRGSVIPFFKKLQRENANFFPITDLKMTRFFINLEDAVKFVLDCATKMNRGEIFVPKMKSINIVDIAKSINPKKKIKQIGVRPGEKIHEYLISSNESKDAYDLGKFFIIRPSIELPKRKNSSLRKGKKVKTGFEYQSANNEFLKIKNIQAIL